MGTATPAIFEGEPPGEILQSVDTGTLNDYLAEVGSLAQAMFDTLVKELSEKENLNEKLKASNPLEWVRRSNNIRNRDTEIVNAEVISV